MKKIISVIGARPQFIKHAPIEFAFKEKVNSITIHTGQHYDKRMSQVFFDELDMSPPHYQLSVGSSSHGEQTGKMMIEIEKIVNEEKPDALLVYGDTNSTLAGAIVASKLHIPIIHVEAGLRSFNKKMPEEVNRIMTDHISDLLFAPTDPAIENLQNEGITKNVYKTGDVMCDMVRIAQERMNDEPSSQFILTTIHRPYNTDDKERIFTILSQLNSLGIPVKFPIHPRTKNRLKEFGIDTSQFENVEFLEPQSYFDMMELLHHAKCLVTDSGGMQKEAYIAEKKCVTVRSETEWLGTLKNGWNTLIFDNLDELAEVIQQPVGEYTPNIYGTGQAAQEITDIILKHLEA
ncbi:MAG: UDP-N-acetylglucosamine 2-epimerase (non-hydrolyzing) [Cytophagales bacterium]|nr:UDP-N-acetylglucosamine 2-epimerase (non-hydrolyzing) [Cytophagales bacterium]